MLSREDSREYLTGVTNMTAIVAVVVGLILFGLLLIAVIED